MAGHLLEWLYQLSGGRPDFVQRFPFNPADADGHARAANQHAGAANRYCDTDANRCCHADGYAHRHGGTDRHTSADEPAASSVGDRYRDARRDRHICCHGDANQRTGAGSSTSAGGAIPYQHAVERRCGSRSSGTAERGKRLPCGG